MTEDRDVSPGADAPPEAPPDAPPTGTVSWTFDNMAEAAAVGRGERSAPDPANDTDLARAYPRLLRTLAEADLSCTFFIEGWNGLHHPRAVAELIAHGHEVGAHGWVHEVWSRLPPHHEERLLVDTLAALRRSGANPSSFRAPGGARTASTHQLLTRHGLAVDSSLVADGFTEPAVITHGEQLTHVPFRWPQVDGYYYLNRHGSDPAPEQTLHAAWRELLLQTARTGGHVTFVSHAFLSAVSLQRLDVLRDLIDLSATLNLRHLRIGDTAHHRSG